VRLMARELGGLGLGTRRDGYAVVAPLPAAAAAAARPALAADPSQHSTLLAGLSVYGGSRGSGGIGGAPGSAAASSRGPPRRS